MARQIPVDALPDLTAPTVTLMTDIHGMAPEEVEALVTRPIEAVVNGAPGVRRVRSNSTFGLSTIWVEFEGDTDIYLARQIVNEKLQIVAPNLPVGAVPMMGAITSIMGEIMTIGIYSDRHSMMELKEVADFTVRKRLLAVPGVSQVVIVGGDTREFRIDVDQNRLKSLSVSLSEVIDAAGKMNENFSAGIMKNSGQDYLIRGMGRVKSVADIEESVVVTRNGIPVLMRDVASITISPAFRIGDTSVNASPAILLSVLKHPQTNTMDLTLRVDKSMVELEKTLSPGIKIDTQVFRQGTFIQRAIDNVSRSLYEATILVILILVFFLGNFRTTIISLTSIPLSLVFSILIFRLLDLNLNTMTLGGIAISIGMLVDDAIIDVENVLRRLYENAARPAKEQKPVYEVMFSGIKEIRASIINATFIIIVVFVPLFFLSGIEGRLLRPLGIAYIASIFGSL
ncbi:MAG TPA: efflux RND transporter permease subunit, partial [Candidatus Rifleibacterium sp.]|nr:efflux RND transporter permease subunit [Candidatus Rifleibacterium sp.]